MERKYYISVAMATYNGERYVRDQIYSILKELKPYDELVISDDGSYDDTIKIIRNIDDPRIKLIKGPRMGVKQNFANAIKNCTGKYIFLADQDDIWLDGKVDKVLNKFEDKVTCVLHDAKIVDEKLNVINNSFFKFRKSKLGKINNIVKNSYVGCCMAFSKELKPFILPIPDDIEMHDQWIGLLSEKYGKSVLLNEPLILYRRHDSNTSSFKHYGVLKMFNNRNRFARRLNHR